MLPSAGLGAAFWIFAACCGALHLALAALLALGWARIGRPDGGTPPVSVLVAAHNERALLPALLEALRAQRYPDYEVIIAADRCTDGSLEWLRSQARAWPQLRVVEIPETPPGWSPKKWALQQAAAEAAHAHWLLTDADCTMGPDWIRCMAAAFGSGTELVLGLGWYQQHPGLLNRFIQWETWYTAFQYAGAAALGLPYMAVGRNLAYTRGFFIRSGGPGAFRARLSGDDDLPVNHFADPARTWVCILPEAATWSVPPRSWRAWLRQKQRHLSASPAYTRRSRALLGAFHLGHLGFYAGILVSLPNFQTLIPAIALYFLRLALWWPLAASAQRKAGQQALTGWLPLLDFCVFLYNLTVTPAGLMKVPSWTSSRPDYRETPSKTATS